MTSLPTERRGFDPLAERTFRKDDIGEIDKSWATKPGESDDVDHPKPSSKPDEHKHHKHEHHHHHHHKHHKHHHNKHDSDSDDDKSKESSKPKTLLEEHLERLKKGEQPTKRQRVGPSTEIASYYLPGNSLAKTKTTSAYWDRERDMEAMHMSRKTATDLLGRAESLNTRFRSSGTSNHFL